MFLIFSLVIINYLIFYSDNHIIAELLMQIESLLIFFCGWFWMKTDSIRGRSVFGFLMIYHIFTLITDLFFYNFFTRFFIIELILLSIISSYIYNRNYNIVSDEINPNNVNLVFYRKNKSLKQNIFSWFGEPVSSFGIIAGDYLYQFKYNKSTMQKIKYNKQDINNKYIVIDTGYSISKLDIYDINLLLTQRARQARTLWLRLNCLRSCRHILNHIKGYEYKGEFLPSIYLNKIMKERNRI